jgi:hypothetical protein
MNRFENLQEAIEMIEEAKELIDQTLRGTEYYDHYKAYACYGLDQALGNGNRYDSSLYQIMENL